LISGNSSQLVSIQFIAEQVKVFNITVEGLNTYHVGRSGILVHNKAMKSSLVTRFGATVTANGALKNAIDRVKSVFSGNGLIKQ
jgi:intein C-terminal splicing region